MEELVSSEVLNKFNANIAKLASEFNIKSAGTGTPFWKPLFDRKESCKAFVRLSKDKTQVYLRVPVSDTDEVNISLSVHYADIQSLVDYVDQQIKIVVAPQILNPALTAADIEGQRLNIFNKALAAGKPEAEATALSQRAVTKALAAFGSEKPVGEFVLLSFTDPAEEE